jgi:hypothetical protein
MEKGEERIGKQRIYVIEFNVARAKRVCILYQLKKKGAEGEIEGKCIF